MIFVQCYYPVSHGVHITYFTFIILALKLENLELPKVWNVLQDLPLLNI